jgi:hypothetical protein
VDVGIWDINAFGGDGLPDIDDLTDAPYDTTTVSWGGDGTTYALSFDASTAFSFGYRAVASWEDGALWGYTDQLDLTGGDASTGDDITLVVDPVPGGGDGGDGGDPP